MALLILHVYESIHLCVSVHFLIALLNSLKSYFSRFPWHCSITINCEFSLMKDYTTVTGVFNKLCLKFKTQSESMNFEFRKTATKCD